MDGTAAKHARGVGAELAAARQERGLGLPEVAQQLKFGMRQLEAFEADRFGDLPGGTFARGMVRSYARLLKIDPEPLLARIAGRFDAPDSNQLAARFSQPVPFSDAGRRSTIVYFGLSLAILLVVGGIAYQWQHERSSPAKMAFVKPKAESASRKPALPAQTVSAAPAQVSEAPPVIEEKKPPVAVKKPAPEEKKPEEKKLVEKKAAEKKPAPAPIVQAAVAAPASGVHRIVMRVVGIACCQVSKRGFGLHPNVILVIVNLEQGFRGVDDPPYHHGRDFDRVGVAVVDLQVRALEVPHAQRDLALCVEGVCPPQPRLPGRANVVAEQLQHLRLVGGHHE